MCAFSVCSFVSACGFEFLVAVCGSILCVLPVCADHLQDLLPDVFLILGSEVLVDWIKHAFLLKFNNIEPEVCTIVVYYTVQYGYWYYIYIYIMCLKTARG